MPCRSAPLDTRLRAYDVVVWVVCSLRSLRSPPLNLPLRGEGVLAQKGEGWAMVGGISSELS